MSQAVAAVVVAGGSGNSADEDFTSSAATQIMEMEIDTDSDTNYNYDGPERKNIQCIWFQCDICFRCFPSMRLFIGHNAKYNCKLKISSSKGDATESEDEEMMVDALRKYRNDKKGNIERQAHSSSSELAVSKNVALALMPSKDVELMVPKKRGRPLKNAGLLKSKSAESLVPKKKGRPLKNVGLEITKIRGSPFSKNIELKFEVPKKSGRLISKNIEMTRSTQKIQLKVPTKRRKLVSENTGKIVPMNGGLVRKIQQKKKNAKPGSKKVQQVSVLPNQGKGVINALEPNRLTFRKADSINLKESKNEELTCSYCQFRFSRIDALNRHINAQHTREIKFVCPYTHKKKLIYYEKRHFNAHLREMHGVQDVKNWSYRVENKNSS